MGDPAAGGNLNLYAVLAAESGVAKVSPPKSLGTRGPVRSIPPRSVRAKRRRLFARKVGRPGVW